MTVLSLCVVRLVRSIEHLQLQAARLIPSVRVRRIFAKVRSGTPVSREGRGRTLVVAKKDESAGLAVDRVGPIRIVKSIAYRSV